MMTEKATGAAKCSPLRQRMIDQMRIANLAASTQTAYLFEVERMAKHYGASPVDLDAEQVRDFVLTLIDKGLSPSSTNSTLSALRFLYVETLGCPERVAGVRNRKFPARLPRAMTEQEVEHLILATPALQHRAAFVTAYGAGLRVSETCASITIWPFSSRTQIAVLASGRVEGWRASVRVRWLFRYFRTGPQSGSHGCVSSPRSSNRTCGFPASGFRTRSCLRARNGYGFPRQSDEAVFILQPHVGELHQYPRLRPVLSTEPLA